MRQLFRKGSYTEPPALFIKFHTRDNKCIVFHENLYKYYVLLFENFAVLFTNALIFIHLRTEICSSHQKKFNTLHIEIW